MAALPYTFPVIDALITRHTEDSAFYWSQLDWTVNASGVGLARLNHFNQLLEAHLDGIKVAGPTGWKIAVSALERWQKSGEVFTCTWLALRSENTDMLDDIFKRVSRRPDDLVRGAVSALAACSPDLFSRIAQRLSAIEAAPASQVAVLRAAALRGNSVVSHLDNPLQTYLQSQTSHVRAAACRACAVAGQPGSVIPLLREALSDPDLQVRAEAAIALGKLGDAQATLPVLLQSVLMQASLYSGATGAIRAQASRRLQRWVRELAWLTPIGAPEARDLLAQLPPRMALTFALWHGDLAHLPFVIDQLADEDVGRYAGWVWQTLTGIDLTASGLALPEPDPASLDPDQLITEARLDADSGHPQADQAAVKAATAASPHLVGRGKRVLLGREIDAKTALDLLENAPQAIRAMAAQI
ncbi:HEAT repeat domain-containing protein, partial [Massilia sp. CCM 8734]|uniref:HEAT repeat domain-containing protein n=1 Tax=Massilia sp. CCM 8734 TaxID=2609283 RepID=UPI0014240F1F